MTVTDTHPAAPAAEDVESPPVPADTIPELAESPEPEVAKPEPSPILRQQAILLMRRAAGLLHQADETQYHALKARTLDEADDLLYELEQELDECRASEAAKLISARDAEDRAKAAADYVAACENEERKAKAAKASPEVLTENSKQIEHSRKVLAEAIAEARAAYRIHQDASAATSAAQDLVTSQEEKTTTLRLEIDGDSDTIIPWSLESFTAAVIPLARLTLERPLLTAEEAYARTVLSAVAATCGIAEEYRQEGRIQERDRFGDQPIIGIRDGKQMIAPPGAVLPNPARPPRS